MTTSNIVDTDNIVLYPILEDNRITLAVKEEYFLQKVGVGAYRVTVLESEQLDQLHYTQHHIVMERSGCLLLHNCYSEGGITAVLIVTEPFKITKNSVLCHVAFTNNKNMLVPVEVHRPDEPTVENEPMPDSTTPTMSPVISIEVKPAPRKPSVFDKFLQ
ncbi:telokinin-like protein-20 [Helicoverpa armigera granulovirus]|uniref:Telokinin-like protein-20 n=1 Tax=Helicoverpa armigera granulovirus TaxID=489830 RepID=A9YMW4_9BBAC|nr:telokinin-like protein-20 [Helicoverpa armigera granulovirus]ABY47813.1 telokinin-like protein-20 [Helicoverpa armigera granulovirus]